MRNFLESLWMFSTVVIFSVFLVCLPAFCKSNYDEKAVLCHDVAKIKVFDSNIELASYAQEEEIMRVVFDYLKNQKYIQKNIKGEDAIFFAPKKWVEAEDGSKNIVIEKVYYLKNPEQVLMAIDADMTEDEMFNTQVEADYFRTNLKAKAAISEKIDRVDRNLFRKTTEMGISSIMGLNNIMPLNPVRPLVTFIFGAFNTNDKERYHKILDEVELMKKGQKDFGIYVMPFDV